MPAAPNRAGSRVLRKPRLLPGPRVAARGAHNIGSRTKLRARDIPSFADAEPPLFGEVARAVCTAGVLPRKELYEADSVSRHSGSSDESLPVLPISGLWSRGGSENSSAA